LKPGVFPHPKSLSPGRGTLKAFPAPLALWERGWG